VNAEQQQPVKKARKRGAPPLIFLIVLLDLLGVGLIAPLSPYIVERFDTSATAVAILTLSYSAAQFLSTPVLGFLSDRYGRRPVLLFSVFGSAIGYAIFATAGSLWVLFLARAFDGATGGNISTAQAYIADITPPEHRAKSYGLVGAAFGLGFTLGPAFGGLIVRLGLGLMGPVWAACGLSLLTAGLIYLRLPETLPPEQRRHSGVRLNDLNPLRTLIGAVQLPNLAALFAAIFLMNLAHAELRTSFGVLLRDKLEYTESSTSWMFAYMGLMAIIVQGGLVRRVAPRLGDARTALVGLPLAALGYALIPLGTSGVWVGAALTILALGGGLAQPTLTSMISGRAPVDQQGRALGASQSASALALVVGPIAAGQLYDHVGRGWPFWTGAMVIGCAVLLVAASGTRAPAPAPVEAA
jgi:predicted MFS family arabinose efflux permease